jgi:tetratricopeptide (TPR) repeat protein
METAVNQALMARARTFLELGDFDRAAVDLDEAERRLREALPAGHYAFAALLSQRARLAQGRGDLPRALHLVNEGLDLAIGAGDGGKGSLPGFFLQRGEIHRRLGQAEAAAADADRSLQLLDETTPTDTRTLSFGQAYLLLARARLAQGQTDAARAALDSALANLEPAAGADHPDARAARELLARSEQ